MDKPTKVQVTVDFEDIPKQASVLLRDKVLREVTFVANVLQQVVNRSEPVPTEDLSFCIDQTRRFLYNADLFLQDAQDMVNGYTAHKAQAALQTMEAMSQETLKSSQPLEENKDEEKPQTPKK